MSISNPQETIAQSPGIAQSIGLSAVFYLIFIVASIAASVFKPFGDVPPNLFAYQLLIPQIIAWPCILWIAVRMARISFRRAFPLTSFPVRILPALALANFGATILLLEVSSWIPVPEAVKKSLFDVLNSASAPMVFVSFVIVAPVAEELFFRGVVLHGYLQRYPATKAIWASAILFAVFHLNPWQAVVALPLGLGCAWLRLRTGSLLPGILSHAMLNGATKLLILPLLTALGYDTGLLETTGNVPGLVVGIGAAATAIGGLDLWRKLEGCKRADVFTRAVETRTPDIPARP